MCAPYIINSKHTIFIVIIHAIVICQYVGARLDKRYTTGSTTIVSTALHRRTEDSPAPEHFNGDGQTFADITVVEINKIE